MKRILFDFLIFISLFFFPSWMIFLLAFAATFLFPSFYEFMIAAFIIDITYEVPSENLGGFRFIFIAFSSILFLISFILKRRLKFY